MTQDTSLPNAKHIFKPFFRNHGQGFQSSHSSFNVPEMKGIEEKRSRVAETLSGGTKTIDHSVKGCRGILKSPTDELLAKKEAQNEFQNNQDDPHLDDPELMLLNSIDAATREYPKLEFCNESLDLTHSQEEDRLFYEELKQCTTLNDKKTQNSSLNDSLSTIAQTQADSMDSSISYGSNLDPHISYNSAEGLKDENKSKIIDSVHSMDREAWTSQFQAKTVQALESAKEQNKEFCKGLVEVKILLSNLDHEMVSIQGTQLHLNQATAHLKTRIHNSKLAWMIDLGFTENR